MITTTVNAISIGLVTGLLMLIPFARSHSVTTSLRGWIGSAKRFAISTLLLCCGMLYSLPNGFITDGVHAHLATGIASFLIFAVGYVLISYGILERVILNLKNKVIIRLDEVRARSGSIDMLCLRVQGARREYLLLKAREALQK